MKEKFYGYFQIALGFTLICIAYNSTAQDLPRAPTQIIVSWSIPVERENGVALSPNDIAGYELFNDCQEGAIAIVGGDVTNHTMAITLPYSCSFAVLAVDNDGLRSDVSETLTITFNAPKAPVINEITVN